MPRLPVVSVSDVGHFNLALEPTSDSVINTFWFSPIGLKHKFSFSTVFSEEYKMHMELPHFQFDVSITVMTGEPAGSFLHDLYSPSSNKSHFLRFYPHV